MSKKTDKLDIEIDRLVELLGDLDPTSKDAKKVTARLISLGEMKGKLEQQKPRFSISGDAVLGAVASVLGIVLILYREELHPVASKSLGFVHKPKF